MALADFCSCKICIHAILGVRAAAKPPWMGLRRSSTGIPHTLKSAKLLNQGIAALTDTPVPNFDLRWVYIGGAFLNRLNRSTHDSYLLSRTAPSLARPKSMPHRRYPAPSRR
ncbi:hypothetical protein EQU24_05055 [Methylotuvimicrobium buryatense]|uniref:Uncharacterized protein n=1 Tax=Methylotuvimicrobium buryatense TaxID=95641 RepID=A0A4V1IJK1_METBY|nr:hypothetical protein EQU24_05055 [Methylotuvimicrobium buryatense]